MASDKGYIIVEGHGEVLAAQNLVVRLDRDLGLGRAWAKPLRWPNLHQWKPPKGGRGGILAVAEFVRTRPDAGALLILRNEDDACPRDMAPEVGARLRDLTLPFPVAYVLLHPEYEVLFLPCLEEMGFDRWDHSSWEAVRGIKEWLSRHLPTGRSYKPTVQQLHLTRKIDFETLRAADVPSFGTLERALRFLHEHWGERGAVRP